jgi:hypothetical protein
VVEIGRPGEPLPELGAARLHIADDRWQAEVLSLMDRAALVVLRIDRSRGVVWEIDQSLPRLLRRLTRIRPSDRRTGALVSFPADRPRVVPVVRWRAGGDRP